MAQDLYFYKQKIFSKKVARLFSQEELHSAVKALLANRDLEDDTKLRGELFEEVLIDFDVSAYEKEIKKLLETDTEFISPQSRRFMMNKKIWSVIQKIVLSKYSGIEKNKDELSVTDSKLDGKLRELCQQLKNQPNSDSKPANNSSSSLQLLSDYSTLEKLFKKNLLFVNIQ
ncbi:hypothetical protein [Coleofasciculus sp. H7-2]|uniref:hypothetical protein n=1 Tax=Coleofasciculus sp. H7-2 TaxID=3351545 RepID=UPI003670B745